MNDTKNRVNKNKKLFLLAFILLQVCGALALLAAFYIELWPLELLVSFTSQAKDLLLVSLVFTTILVLLLRNYKTNLPNVAGVLVLWASFLAASYVAAGAQQPTEFTSGTARQGITFATFNKLYTNDDTDRYIAYFKQQDIDILALQEMNPADVAYVAEQLGFEYSQVSRTFASSGGTAVALLSRYPFVSAETIELDTQHPVVRAVIQTPNSGAVAAYSVHIPVPASNFLYNKRNIVMRSLAETLEQEELPVIIGGDFNTTVYSPAMRAFASSTATTIKPIVKNQTPECSWYGYGDSMCIRIDHIFVSQSIKVHGLTIAPNLGSDHRALIAEISL